MACGRWIVNAWYSKKWFCHLLRPFSWVFGMVASMRKARLLKSERPPFDIPVIVVGNITVGGTGKTPLVIYLIELLRASGYHPGVISRGYGGSSNAYPRIVDETSYASTVGDESVVVYQRTKVPMVVDPVRNQAAQTLKDHFPEVNVIIADDGLQHYALRRDIEIAVVDARRGFGNGLLLPAGPLREPIKRLDEVDLVITNGQGDEGEHTMTLVPKQLININQPIISKPISEFTGERVHAVAGIGNPQRFFNLLTKLGCDVINHTYPDHYPYRPTDLSFGDNSPVIMTEKDMVKCKDFAEDNWWYLTVDITCDPEFDQKLMAKLSRLTSGQETH